MTFDSSPLGTQRVDFDVQKGCTCVLTALQSVLMSVPGHSDLSFEYFLHMDKFGCRDVIKHVNFFTR